MENKKIIITVLGHDTVGIIAAVTTYLAENKINILDISHTIVSGFFHMMTIADMADATVSFATVSESLAEIGKGLGVDVKCQKEEIFEKMHRI